jgi:hypothetical protein
MEIHSIDGYGTDAYIYLQVNKIEFYKIIIFHFRLLKIKQVNGYQYVIVLLMNIIFHEDINQIGQKRNNNNNNNTCD